MYDHKAYMKEYRQRPKSKLAKRIHDARAYEKIRGTDDRRLKSREIHLKNKYGITNADFNRMFNEQDGRCFICNVHQSDIDRTFCVDHNHVTGKVRKLLCFHCNAVIGLVNESAEILNKIIAYLKEESDARSS